jgi:amino acid transporter
MADPVSSVAYAIEAPLRALGGHLNLLLPTMGLVVGIIALVTLNYWQLVRAFPQGGGSPEAAGRAFGSSGRSCRSARWWSTSRSRSRSRSRPLAAP